jgi:hypothetical protein
MDLRYASKSMEQSNFVPWEKYPDLTPERLTFIASLIRDVREGVAEEHSPELGDGPWGFGCRAYERTCFAFSGASETQTWLTILPCKDAPLRFAFAVGNIPFRFYRGDPQEPPSRYLETTHEEIRHWQLALDLDMVSKEALLRIAVETDATGRAKTITVVEMNELKSVAGSYSIPFATQRVTVVPFRSRPVETPAPTVEPLGEPQEANGSEERNVAEG